MHRYLIVVMALFCAHPLVAADPPGNHPIPLKIRVISGDEVYGAMANSVLIEGEREIVLIDAQRSIRNADKVIAAIRSTGKRLKSIFITHAHPDHYFGASVILAAFPGARFWALAGTAKTIRSQGEETRLRLLKLPQNGVVTDQIPDRIALPEVLGTDGLEIEARKLPVQAVLHGETEEAGIVLVPDQKILIAGDLLYQGTHLWLRESRFDGWRNAITQLEKIRNVETVIPGHGSEADRSLFEANRSYIAQFASVVEKSHDSREAIDEMKRLYPRDRMERFLTYGVEGYFLQRGKPHGP